MKSIDAKTIGRLPESTQVLLLDYMKLLDQKRHTFIFGISLPLTCVLLCIASFAINDMTLISASCSLFISFSGLMVFEGKPWRLGQLIFTLKNYRVIFKEEYQLDIRKLTSREIWSGLTLAIDTGSITHLADVRNTSWLIVSLFISVMIFVMVLFVGVFIKNPSTWVVG